MTEFTVAIELGSSKITGIAGRKNNDGSINVLAITQEDSTQCIRKGVVYNIDKTAQALANIVKRLETTLKCHIAQVYVGVGGQSIQSVRNTINKDILGEGEVTSQMIYEIDDINRDMTYPDKQMLDAVTQEYKVDNIYTIDPVGVQCQHLEGNFLNIICRKNFSRNLAKCFDQANISVLDKYLSPIVMADSVLTEVEKRSGCLLVDMGAETTSFCVYHKGILRHIAVVPLGCNNITKDIATVLQLEDKDAEQMKLKYASAFTDSNDIEKDRTYPLDNDGRTVKMTDFIDIVEARTREIIENVWQLVPFEYTDKLISGIVITGGGSNMRNIERAFRTYTKIEKVRVAKSVNLIIKSSNALVKAEDGRLCTVLGLLDKGDQNCAGEDFNGTLFGTSQGDDKPKATHTVASGRIIDQEEIQRQKEAEEAKRKAEEAEALRKQQEEEERLAEERRKNSFWGKVKTGVKAFTKKMVTEEDDDVVK